MTVDDRIETAPVDTERVASAGHGGDELEMERAAVAHIGKLHHAYLDHSRRVAEGLAAEAAEAVNDGIRDIVDEDAEADAAVEAVLVRQISERAMYAARRVADLEAQGDALAFGKLVADPTGKPAAVEETDRASDRRRETPAGGAPVPSSLYVGRRTVFDGDDPLLIDWRARAAIPFYRATPLEPMGYRQRRHLLYDGTGPESILVDYSDEVFDVDHLSAHTGADGSGSPNGGLRGEAALLANLVAPTGEQMRSVVATIQAEQDAVIRSPANRMLIVQGGPGTGKTVVALHRAAYLLYDQRVDLADTGVLIVGPSNQFLNYISGVLPSLGESGVVSVTVPRLYRGVRLGADEPEAVAATKSGAVMVGLLAAAVGQRRRRPTERFVTWYGSRRVVIDHEVLDALFARAVSQPLHNDGAARFRRDIIDNLIYQVYDPAFHNLDDARSSFEDSEEVTEFLLRHFPSLTPEQALNDLLGSPGLLRAAARAAGLDDGTAATLHRRRTPERELDRRIWSNADAALLDELLALLGPVLADGQRLTAEDVDDEAWRVRDEADEFELARSDGDHPLPSIDPFERPSSPDDVDGPRPWDDPYFDDPSVDGDDGARWTDRSNDELTDAGPDERPGPQMSLSALADQEAEPPGERERSSIETALAAEGRKAPEYDGAPAEALDLEAVDAAEEDGATVAELVGLERSWQFGHVIVDEAQDLTPMQWRMVARRSSGGALTVVGDLAQRVGPPVRGWDEIVPAELARHDLRELTINYRSPSEIDEISQALLSHISPNLTTPRSLRTSGRPPSVVTGDDPLRQALKLARAELAGEAAIRVACIVAAPVDVENVVGADHDPRLSILTAGEAKGLEFDVVLVVEPADIADQEYGLNLLYVATTRATRTVIFVHHRPLPDILATALPHEF